MSTTSLVECTHRRIISDSINLLPETGHFGPPRELPGRGIASANGPERAMVMHATAGNITTYAIKLQNQPQEPPPPVQNAARQQFYPRLYHARHPADDRVIEQWENEVLGQRQGEGLLEILRQGFLPVPRFNISGGYVTDWSQSVAAELITVMRASPEATRNPWYIYTRSIMRTSGTKIILTHEMSAIMPSPKTRLDT